MPQDVPGALQFVPSILNMRPANGVFTSVQGLVTAMFKVPAGYTLDGNVQLKTPLSTTLFPAVTDQHDVRRQDADRHVRQGADRQQHARGRLPSRWS